MFDRTEEFVPLAPRFPHAADALALLFRDSGVWHDMEQWFVDYVNGDWGTIEWSVAQFGLMFPSKGDAPKKVCDYFSEQLARGSMSALLIAHATALEVANV